MQKIQSFSPKQGITPSHRKENNFSRSYAVISGINRGVVGADVELRIYETKSRFYACLWVHTSDVHCHGSGWAGGYGYCKESAAAAAAIQSAGFDLQENIAGRGRGAIETAVMAIAQHLGVIQPMLFVAHG